MPALLSEALPSWYAAFDMNPKAPPTPANCPSLIVVSLSGNASHLDTLRREVSFVYYQFNVSKKALRS